MLAKLFNLAQLKTVDDNKFNMGADTSNVQEIRFEMVLEHKWHAKLIWISRIKVHSNDCGRYT